METKLSFKILQHLNLQKIDSGFSLIELIIVIMCMAVLATIALPSLLNQATKAKQAEAKQNVSSMNRGQQLYFTENGNFTNDLAALGIGVLPSTTHYNYSAALLNNTTVYNMGTPKTSLQKSYTGIVYLDNDKLKTLSMMCEADDVGQSPVVPTIVGCPGNSHELKP